MIYFLQFVVLVQVLIFILYVEKWNFPFIHQKDEDVEETLQIVASARVHELQLVHAGEPHVSFETFNFFFLHMFSRVRILPPCRQTKVYQMQTYVFKDV